LASSDAQKAEQRFALEPANSSPPDREFDRHWALATLGPDVASGFIVVGEPPDNNLEHQ
jgi:hypothetical protein